MEQDRPPVEPMETREHKPGTWVKGQSGNPAGRAKGSLSVVESLQRALERKWIVPPGEPDAGDVRTKLDHLCRSMVDLAIHGSVPAAQWVGDRLEGRAATKVEVTGGGGQQIVVVPWLPATQEAIQAARQGGQDRQAALPAGPHPDQGDQDASVETPLPGEVEILNHREHDPQEA